MIDSRTPPAKLARIAELQSLRTMAGKADLAQAQRRCDAARGRLEEREQALAERAGEVERCFAADRLDLTVLGIGRAVLAALSVERDLAQGALSACDSYEAERRAEWLRQSQLSKRAEGRLRKAVRHAAQKREDRTTTELTIARFIHAGRTHA